METQTHLVSSDLMLMIVGAYAFTWIVYVAFIWAWAILGCFVIGISTLIAGYLVGDQNFLVLGVGMLLLATMTFIIRVWLSDD